MPEPKVIRVPRTFKLPPDLIEAYEAAALRAGVTKTTFVENALRAALGAPTVAGRRAGTVKPPKVAEAAVAAPARPVVRDAGVARADAFRASLERNSD
jgi:hypothetical protein